MSPPMLPRDERGWRVPREGTVSRLVYELALEGHGPTMIGEMVGLTQASVSVLLWRIKHPEEANAAERRRYAPAETAP